MVEALKVLAASLLIASLYACGAQTKPNARDSNSNWLATCEVTADCDGDGSCICGLCTAPCRDDGDCESAGPGASCVRPDEASGEVACAAIVEAAGQNVCLAECVDDGDCRDGSSCESGACWAAPSAVIDRRDAQVEDAQVQDAQVEDAQVDEAPPLSVDTRPDLWALDASVDFDDPVAAPVPETELEGEQAFAVVGVWNEVQSFEHFSLSPMRLEIIEDDAGRITGTVMFMCEEEHCWPRGPLPPATDPDAGYPPDINYDSLAFSNVMAFVPYRIFDARVEDGRLRFWITNNDTWRDWCVLQTPYPATIDGRQIYACTPNPPSVWDLIGTKGNAPKDVLCATDISPCRCTADGCAMDYHGARQTFDLEIQGHVLSGIHQTQPEMYVVKLMREGVAP